MSRRNAAAPAPSPRDPWRAQAPAQPAAVRYVVEAAHLHAHLWRITLTLQRPAARQRVSLPVWIPGSYMVREFSQHLQGLCAQADGYDLGVRQLNKNTWELRPAAGTRELTLRYEVYAFDTSVRTAFLDATRGFFNPTSLCLRAAGYEQQAHALQVLAPAACPHWQLATALPAATVDERGFGCYVAADYDELADSPVALGPHWSGQFDVRGRPHRFVVHGAPAGFDGQRLLQDTARICEAAMALWHGPDSAPHDRYLFLLHASAEGYGGLEHRHSTALLCQRSDLPLRPDPATPDNASPPRLQANDGYTNLLGLISHEYFHTWNVKRLRPQALEHIDYERENYTDQLWFFEGFTSYYDDLLLLRAGLIDESTHLQLLAKTINQVLQTPGRHVQSVAQASWDAWIKYYRVQENTPNATVSYYAKGALVALCLDLSLRADGHTTLDEVMAALYQRCHGGPMKERDLLAVLQQLGRRRFDDELHAWVHGCDELPLPALLARHGIQWRTEAAPLAQRLGLRVSEQHGLMLKNVLRGSAAETAGLAAGDEWLALETTGPQGTHTWRVRKLDDVAQHAIGADALIAWVARDGVVLRCPLHWPGPSHTVSLVRSDTPLIPSKET